MVDEDEAWFIVCYPVGFEENMDGVWSWSFVNHEVEKRSTTVFVKKNISYGELCEKLRVELGIDTSIYDFEMKWMAPIGKALPMVITCDKQLRHFLLVYDPRKDALLVSLKRKEADMYIEIEARNRDDVIVNEEEYVEEAPLNIVSQDTWEDNNVSQSALTSVPIEEPYLEEMHLKEPYLEETHLKTVSQCTFDDNIVSQSVLSSVPIEETCLNNFLQDPLLDILGDDCFVETASPRTLNVDDGNLNEKDEGLSVDDTFTGDDRESPNMDTFIGVDCNRNVIQHDIGLDEETIVSIPDNEDILVNDRFAKKGLLKYKVEMLAVKFHFEFDVQTTNTMVYVVVCASKECNWRLRATRVDTSKCFEVQRYASKHTCLPIVHRKDHRHASYKLIGRYYSPNYVRAECVFTANDIIANFNREFKCEISYPKAISARNYAIGLIWGDPHKSFGKLPKFFQRLKKTNPDTVTDIHTVGDHRFKYCFMALGASIHGFQSSMRPVISVDGTHLKSIYKGTLLIATCQDGNYQIFPLAWAIVDSENNLSWTWFFQRLKRITGDTKDLVILSDRAESITHGFKEVYKQAHHGHCIYHMQKNLRTHYPRRGLTGLFIKAAHAYTERSFKLKFEALCKKCRDAEKSENPDPTKDIAVYLDEASFPLWSRAHFPGERYNIMTTNNAESLNSKLRRAREFSIVGLLKYIRDVLQIWFAKRSSEAAMCSTPLTPKIQALVNNKYKFVSKFTVSLIVQERYDVLDLDAMMNYIVDLVKRTCTCKKFDLDRIPCDHAVAVTKNKSRHAYEYCSWYFGTECWRQAYSKSVLPLPNVADCEFPDDVLAMKVLPPLLEKRQSGRPKSNKRIPSAGDAPKTVKATKRKKKDATPILT